MQMSTSKSLYLRLNNFYDFHNYNENLVAMSVVEMKARDVMP